MWNNTLYFIANGIDTNCRYGICLRSIRIFFWPGDIIYRLVRESELIKLVNFSEGIGITSATEFVRNQLIMDRWFYHIFSSMNLRRYHYVLCCWDLVVARLNTCIHQLFKVWRRITGQIVSFKEHYRLYARVYKISPLPGHRAKIAESCQINL